MTESLEINNNSVAESEAGSKVAESANRYKVVWVWRNIILMIMLHTSAIYGLYIGLLKAKWETVVFSFVIAILSSMGVQAGAHRLWAHKTYKAKLPLQILLAFLQTLALQNDIYEWSRDHRVHHKFSETDADPHNSKRGFFFSHVGWLLMKKHPDVISKGKTVDMSDLENDPLVRFQRTFYIPLVILIWGLLPTYIPYFFWNESVWNSFFYCVMFRYCITVNLTWCVNSAAHMYGYKPYDKNIDPVEASMRHLLMGEGFHNYHHSFPWDYSASEFGALDVFNPATAFIDFFAKIGLAYDLKTATNETVKNRQKRSGKVEDLNVPKNNTPFYEWSTGLLFITVLLWLPLLVRTVF